MLMKNHLKIPLLIFAFCLFTFAFIGDSPPGWYQQTLPVNDIINDIFFLDSVTGWVVTQGGNGDTSRIMNTTNGGTNWAIQIDSLFNLAVIQFIDASIGYAAGGNGRAKFLKTTNGGNLWTVTTPFGSGISDVKDMQYINKDTGWFCSNDPFGGGIFKTTNGGINWQNQLGASFLIKKIFMLNNDTGWSGSTNNRLYKTTNSGANWNLQFTFNNGMDDFFFVNKDTGWAICWITSDLGIKITTDGGNSWNAQNTPAGLSFGMAPKLFAINTRYVWAGMSLNKILATTNGGVNWGTQTTPMADNFNVYFTDTIKGWAGRNGLVKTTDGGGPISQITNISSEIPSEYKLYQNYPNPFNPITNIKYQIVNNNSQVKLAVYDIQGKQVAELVNQKQSAGTYQADWDASEFSSGVYFYSLLIEGRVAGTKKMLMVK
jgi:photosystem II stability/assembly factor-like uncharacterized protein